jgi:hypothetical protein
MTKLNMSESEIEKRKKFLMIGGIVIVVGFLVALRLSTWKWQKGSSLTFTPQTQNYWQTNFKKTWPQLKDLLEKSTAHSQSNSSLIEEFKKRVEGEIKKKLSP